VHSIWDFWISALQKCKGKDFEVGQGGHNFSVRSKKNLYFFMGVALARM
jgi:hypothetical protein